MFQRILIAVDGSDTSNNAVEQTAKLIKGTPAIVLIVHVMEQLTNYPGIDYMSLHALYQKEGQQVLNNAHNLIAQYTANECQTKLIEVNQFQGRTSEIICNEANQWTADLLVLGTHGRRGFSRLFLGSVAENTVRIAQMPVLLVPSKIAQ
jgi:nucleotide-binding universal stress UspA family protein